MKEMAKHAFHIHIPHILRDFKLIVIICVSIEGTDFGI